ADRQGRLRPRGGRRAQAPRVGAAVRGGRCGRAGQGVRGARERQPAVSEPAEEPVLYAQTGAVAVISLNRPRYRNAQNSAMTYSLDAAFHRAAMDDEIAVIVLRGNGEHFSAGHDIGS